MKLKELKQIILKGGDKKTMKTKIKQEKGITLIALVITIVVLLILAGVSINAIFSENGIINKAKDAQNKMDEAQQKDLNSINELNNWIDSKTNGATGGSTGGNTTGGGDNPSTPSGTWTQNKTTVTDGKTTYTVGDDYTYNCGVSGYTGGWKVLGADKGKLLIMSTVNVGKLGLKGVSGDGTITYPAGYTNGIAKLKEMCAPYGKNARSITVEDINRVTGYVPEHQTISITSENKYYYDNDTTNQSSTATGTYAAYAGTYGLATALGITNNEPVTGNAYYYYYPNTLTTSSSGTTAGIETTSPAYKLLFRNADDSANYSYWLASSGVGAYSNLSGFVLRAVRSGGLVGCYVLWESDRGANVNIFGVRAVVSL